MAPSRAAIMLSRHVNRHMISQRTYASSSRLPVVASPSFWSSLIPKFLRKPTTPEEAFRHSQVNTSAAEEKRTGLTFLILGLVVGSNAINIIALKRQMLNFSRETDAKLELLREVVQRVKNGEDVDVKKLLGTGDKKSEQEWESVVKDLETTDMLWEGRRRRDKERAEKKKKEEAARKRDEKAAAATEAREDGEEGKPSRPKFLM